MRSRIAKKVAKLFTIVNCKRHRKQTVKQTLDNWYYLRFKKQGKVSSNAW